MKIDGRLIAERVVDTLLSIPRPKRHLTAILVGSSRASVSFLAQKEKLAKRLGVDFRILRLGEGASQEELKEKIEESEKDDACGGIILQLPLPESLDRKRALNLIPKEKDVDVLSEAAIAAFRAKPEEAGPPPIATIKEIFRSQGVDISQMNLAVVGYGLLVGKPIAEWAKKNAKTVEVFTSQSDLAGLKNADAVILGAGKAGLVGATMLKSGALVIDFGYDATTGAPLGDFDPQGADEAEVRYTPTPGGTGPILVAELFRNFYILNGAKIV